MRGRGGGGCRPSPRGKEGLIMGEADLLIREGDVTFGSEVAGEGSRLNLSLCEGAKAASDLMQIEGDNSVADINEAQEVAVNSGGGLEIREAAAGQDSGSGSILHGKVTSGAESRSQGTSVEAIPLGTRNSAGGSGEGGRSAQGVNEPVSKEPAWKSRRVVPLPGKDLLGEFSLAKDRVRLDQEDIIEAVKRMEGALVGRTFGRRIPFMILNEELHRRWKGFGSFRLITISGDSFVCIFDNAESRDVVLMGGPWVVAGQVLGLDKWSTSFSPSSKDGFVTPVWIRLPGLPLYCWGERNIARIAACIGEPLWMDAATSRMERGLFARVCVRMDLMKPLLPGIWAEGPYGTFYQKVEYEGISSFCFNCGQVGHKISMCNVPKKHYSHDEVVAGEAPVERCCGLWDWTTGRPGLWNVGGR